MHISNFSLSIKDLYANIKNLYIQKWGRCCGPCVLPYNVVGVVSGFNVAARQDLAGVLVNVDGVLCNGKLLGVVGCNPEVSCLCILAIPVVTSVVCAMFEYACVSVDILKACTLPIVGRSNPIAAPFGVSIDKHSMYLLKSVVVFCNPSI